VGTISELIDHRWLVGRSTGATVITDKGWADRVNAFSEVLIDKAMRADKATKGVEGGVSGNSCLQDAEHSLQGFELPPPVQLKAWRGNAYGLLGVTLDVTATLSSFFPAITATAYGGHSIAT